jgi:alpha-beta hydrolase superfamily lysophospholipase
MGYIATSVDVTEGLPQEISQGERLFISAWVFMPAPTRLVAAKNAVVVLLNGATYDKRYWHLSVPGRSGYSMAEYLQERGHVVVLLDHLGVGESSRPSNGFLIDRHIAARASELATMEIFDRLAKGRLDPAVAPLSDFTKVGVGHSMGSMLLITQQATYRTFDRVAITGYTAIGVHMMVNGVYEDGYLGPIDYSRPAYITVAHELVRESFFYPDIPPDVIAVDNAMTVNVPYVLIVQTSTSGIITREAGEIDVPVHICLGEIDLSPHSDSEPSYYRKSPHVTLHILKGSAHCQVLANTRVEMFERLHGWIGAGGDPL